MAAVGNTIVAGNCPGTDLYALEDGNEEWITHEGLHGPICNVFSNQNSCYVAAGRHKKIFQWNVDTHTWYPITDIPTQLSRGIVLFSLVASDEHIYMLGGWLNGQAVNRAFVYDMKSDTWHPLPNTPFTSCFCSSVLINNTLYVAGGATINSSGMTVPVGEVSALTLNESNWRRLTPLTYGGARVTALYERLIATGGESLDGHASNHVEVFDVISDQWLPLPHMTTPRCLHGVCVTENNSLAAVGGFIRTECEILKLQTNSV